MTGAQTGGEAEAEPPKGRSWLLGCALVLVLAPILVMALFVTCVYFGPRAGPSTDEVRGSVDDALQPGATVEEIQAYLRSSAIDYRSPGSVGTASDISLLEDEYALRPETPIVYGFAGETGSGGVTVVFVLDENERYSRLIIIEHFGL
jgi:hypothetical protein